MGKAKSEALGEDPRLAEADALLREIGEVHESLAAIQRQAQGELQTVHMKYAAFVSAGRDRLADKHKALVKLMRTHKKAFFVETDKVSLAHGWLIHGEEKKVVIPRDALEKIEAQGWDEAIKIAKSVDREVVEKWDEERLSAIGAERKKKEKFEYETRRVTGDG